MQFQVKNRFNGAVQFTAEIECDDDDAMSIKLGMSVKWAIKSGAYLGGAYLGGADLRAAYLGAAYLGGAYLGGADLRGADLRGADLGDQWIIQGPVRSDGYAFFLQKLKDDDKPMVKAGCRYVTIPEAHAHWTETRGGTPLGEETFAILDFLERAAVIRDLIPQKNTGGRVMSHQTTSVWK